MNKKCILGILGPIRPKDLIFPDQQGLASAYSLHRVTPSYKGSPIRVRRSLDNLEQDIPFKGMFLDIEYLSDFLMGSNGFTTVFYDQKVTNDISSAISSEQASISGANMTFDLNDTLVKATPSIIQSKPACTIVSNIYPTDVNSVVNAGFQAIMEITIGGGDDTRTRGALFLRNSLLELGWRRLDAEAYESLQSGAATIQNNTRYTVAGVIGYQSQNKKIYINGSLNASTIAGTTGNTDNSVPSSMHCGLNLTQKFYPFFGDIETILIYDQEKNDSQIQKISKDIEKYWL